MKKVICLILILVCFAFMMAACSSDTENKLSEITELKLIRIVTTYGDYYFFAVSNVDISEIDRVTLYIPSYYTYISTYIRYAKDFYITIPGRATTNLDTSIEQNIAYVDADYIIPIMPMPTFHLTGPIVTGIYFKNAQGGFGKYYADIKDVDRI